MSPADREQIEIFEQYLMRVDWHLLIARYSEAQIRRWIELGDLDAQHKQALVVRCYWYTTLDE